MHIKRLTACALAALLAISPLNLPSVSADPVQDSNLVLYSSFDDETANDASGAGNNGTITKDSQYGTVEFVEGVNGGKAIRIVNDSNHRKKNLAANFVDYGSNLKFGTSDFSVSLWYKTDAEGVSPGDTANDDHGGNDVSIFGNKDYDSGTNRGLTLGNFSANTPADVRVNFVAKQGTRVEINKVYVCDDTWHHLAATFDRDGSMSVYVDGALYGSKDISTYKDLSIDVDGQNFVLGADGVHTYGTPGATVDELRMYRSALTPDQVTELYDLDKPSVSKDLTTLHVTFDNGTAEDSSSHQTNGTIVGAVEFVDGVKGKAVKISNDASHRKGNTAEQYITFGKQPGVTFGSSDFTLAFWHKSIGHGASDSAILGNKDYASGSNVGLAVGNYHAPNVNSIDDLRMNISGKKGSRIELKNISGNNDNWHYIVTSFDRDGYMTVYMDGRKIGAVDMSGQAGTSVDDGEFVLGADGHFTYGADGCLLDEVRIIKKALTESECSNLYRSEALSLKLNEMEQMISIAGTEEYSQENINAFKASLERIKGQAANADEDTAAALCAELENAYALLQDSAKKPLLTFDVLADVHLRDSDSSRAAKFTAGLKDIAANHADSDALVTLGDNISFGSDNNSRTQYFDLIEQYAGQIPNKLIALGNHDVRKNDSSSSTGFSSNYAVAYEAYMRDNKKYRDDPDSDKVYFDKWINGYHFIVLNTEDGLKDCIDMSEEQLVWFEQKLGEGENGAAGTADPEKPVFVAVHQALNDTHPRANAYGGFTKEEELMNRVREILSGYPQAVVMSGHIHNGFGIATTMDKTYGTMIDCPSFNESENGITESGTGYQVNVYADRIHFRARNYVTATWMPEFDLILSVPSLPSVTAEAGDKVETDYTAESWGTFSGFLSNAKALLNSANESARLEVFAAAQKLKTAMAGLKVDMSELQTVYDKYAGELKEDYTPESWIEFEAAKEAAETVLKNEGGTVTPKDVADAAAALEEAAKKLIKAEQPTEPESSTEATEPSEPESSTEATEPSEPESSTEATEPSEPESSTEATEPSEPEISTEATEPSEPESSTEATEPSETETSPDVTKPTEPETSPDVTTPTETEISTDATTPAETESSSDAEEPGETESSSDAEEPGETESSTEETEPGEIPSSTVESTPGTGDSTNMSWLILVTVIALATVAGSATAMEIAGRKRKQNRNQ